MTDALPVHASAAQFDAGIIIAELANNASRHARTPFTVTVSTTPDAVTIEVQDGSGALPEVQPLHVEADAGRGLHIVNGLADEWGTTSDGTSGKTVWARLDLRTRAPST
jgi:serine/threonine-protein kinase RsbW